MSALENKIQRINALKNKTIDNNFDLFDHNIIKVQNAFLSEVFSFLDVLPKEAGVIAMTPENLNIVINSMESLNRSLIEAGYGGLIDEYITVSNDLIKYTRNTFAITGIDTAFTEKDVKTLHMIQSNISNKFNVIGQNAVRTVVDNLQQAVMGNTTYKDLAKNLTDTIIGTDKKGGLLKRYANVYAHDAMIEMDRGINLMAANNFDAEYFLYSGPVDQVTRDFCAEHAGKVYTKDAINNMSNGVGTDVWTHCGGYNCRHTWLPVSKTMLDEFSRG